MRERGLDVFKLKLIAFTGTAMLFAAWSGIIPSSLQWLRILLGFLGSVSIPVISLVLSEAIKHTRSVTLYMVRLLVMAVLCAFPYFMIYHDPSSGFRFSDYLSGPFTVFYCVGILLIYNKLPYKWLKTGSVFMFVLISVFIGIEFAPVSVIMAYIVFIYSSEKERKFRDFNIILFSVAIGVVGGLFLFFGGTKLYNIDLVSLVSLSGCALAVPLLRLYSGSDNSFENKAVRFIAKYSFYFAYLMLTVGLALLKYYVIASNASA